MDGKHFTPHLLSQILVNTSSLTQRSTTRPPALPHFPHLNPESTPWCIHRHIDTFSHNSRSKSSRDLPILGITLAIRSSSWYVDSLTSISTKILKHLFLGSNTFITGWVVAQRIVSSHFLIHENPTATEKKSEGGGNHKYAYAVAEMQGWRISESSSSPLLIDIALLPPRSFTVLCLAFIRQCNPDTLTSSDGGRACN